MIKYFESTARKKASNLLHLSLIILCSVVSVAYWMLEHPVNMKFFETFKSAVHNAGIGEWRLDTVSGSFEHDEITKSLIGEVSTFNDLINVVDPKDRPLIMKNFYTSSGILMTCSIRGKNLTFSGVANNGVVTGIVYQ